MILVISYPEEDHTQAIVPRLQALGARVVQIDLADFPAQRRLNCEWSAGTVSYQVETVDGLTELNGTKVAWWRRVSPFKVDPKITEPTLASFALSETAQAVEGMLDSLPCKWINSRQHDTAAHHKPLQWTCAQQVGLRLPRTLTTTCPEQAKKFIHSLGLGRVVVKPFLATFEIWRETRLVQVEDLKRLDTIRYAPAIFQECIDGVDLRITIIGEHVFTAEIDARATQYPYDMRMVLGESKIQAVELPETIRLELLALFNLLGIQYGAVDMRRTDAGEYYFLEVNPAGQWLFAERYTGLPISQTIAEYLFALSQV